MHSEEVVSNPLVTVITVSYNSSKFIRDAIESVLTQSYENIEFIIGDDGSTDSTWEIINEYKDARIKTYRNEINLGEYPNRNKAVEMSNGEYIFFIDADDLVLHRGISDGVREFKLHPACGFGVVKLENPKFIGPIRIARKDALNLEFFGGGLLDSSLASNVYRTSFLKLNHFLTKYRNSDTYSRIKFLTETDVLILNSPIAIWRQTDGQASRRISLRIQMWERLQFYKEIIFNNSVFLDSMPVQSLKNQYYKLLIRVVILDFRSFKIAFLKIGKFILDDWLSIVEILSKKNEPEYWSEFNYSNVNIEFRQRAHRNKSSK